MVWLLLGRATTTASRVLQMGLILGLALAFILGIGLHFGAKIFTQDANVLQICLILGLALAFILGIGLHFGAKIFTQDANVLQICLILGLTLTFILGIGLHFGAKIFTQDANVLHLIQIGITFVVVTQPLNSLAFVFYGVNFGASDFAYSAFSMNWNGIRTLGVPKELMTAHGRHRSYSFILGLGFSGVC
ncbi:MATE efflux family protein FRD3 [Glycine soja]|nr:MATE efflux family protein FRD3 [Glycine soja]